MMNKWHWVVNWWEMKKWRRSDSPTTSEIDVVRAILSEQTFRTERLLLQVTDAPGVERRLVGGTSYVMSIPYVKDDSYLIDIDSDCESPYLPVFDEHSGRKLEFSIRVREGGFLTELVGRTLDGGAWPVNWTVSTVGSLSLGKGGSSWLPFELSRGQRKTALAKLENWLGEEHPWVQELGEDQLMIRGEASKSELVAAETRVGCALPLQYRELMEITNGLSIRAVRLYEILGTRDIWCEKMNEGEMGLVVSSFREDGNVTIVGGAGDLGRVRAVGDIKEELKEVEDLRDLVRFYVRGLKDREKTSGLDS